MTHDPDNPERDPVLAATWREHSAEMPPAALDAAILAAAHRAVGSAPQDSVKQAAGAEAPDATRPQRWWMPLAAAATIGAIALGILQTVPQEPSVTPHSASDMPAPASSPASPLREKLALDERKDAPRAEGQSTAQRADASEAPPPAAPTVHPAAPPANGPAKLAGKVIAQSNTDSFAATAPLPAATSPAAAPQPFPAEQKRDAGESGAANDRASRMLAAPASAPPTSEVQRQKESAAEEQKTAARAQTPAAAPAPERMAAASDDKRQRNEVAQSAPMASSALVKARKAASAEQDAAMKDSATADAAKQVDVDAWIVRIRKLHDDGKLADAAKELVAMRAAVPDADRRLPAELRAWAATVKP